MKKILFIALVALFAFASTPKASQTLAVTLPEKNCGAILFFNNTSGATVYRVRVDWSSPSHTDQVYYYPTFPFNTGTRCCGGGVNVIVDFTSGSGIIQASDYDDLLACETFEAPYLSPLVFTTSCNDYFINITSGTECP